MSCIDVTQLVEAAYPGGLRTLRAAHTAGSAYRNFMASLVDVVYFFTQLGGQPGRFRQMLRFAFAAGRAEQGIARGRIPSAVLHLIDDLDNLWGRVPPAAFRALIEDMGSQFTKFRGGEGVLRVLRQRGYSRISNLEVLSNTTRRIYDIVLDGGRRLAIEVKNYPGWARMGRARWANSVSKQMLRDLMHTTGPGRDFIWIFFTTTENMLRTGQRGARTATRAEFLAKMFDGMGVALFTNSRRRIPIETLLQRLNRVTPENIRSRGTDLLLELLGPPGSFASNKQKLMDAIQDLHRSNGARIFLDPN